jgi:hypothetical protein
MEEAFKVVDPTGRFAAALEARNERLKKWMIETVTQTIDEAVESSIEKHLLKYHLLSTKEEGHSVPEDDDDGDSSDWCCE